MKRNISLAYGKTGLQIEVASDVKIVYPKFISGLRDESMAIRNSLCYPIDSPPLHAKVKPGDRVVISHSDMTRATPNNRILTIILSELESHGVKREDIVLLNALGTHRKSTPEEMVELLGNDLFSNYQCIQHDAFDPEMLIEIGKTSFGNKVRVNRLLMDCDVRIYTGFIEPHLFAGFSGGPKSVLPALAGFESVQTNHSQKMLDHENATWGITSGNPVWEEMKEVALMTDPTFLVNVTLNNQKLITGVFSGELIAAHQAGCSFAKECATKVVDSYFDVVITTNSGYPLDQNLYQSIKGISAASRIVRPGGAILLLSACDDGVPENSHYIKILESCSNPSEVLKLINQPGFSQQDQWQVQIQARIQQNAEVYVYSEGLSDDEIRTALFTPVSDLPKTLISLRKRFGDRVCIIPEGPLTIPVVQE